MSDWLRASIQADEGLRLQVYDDATGRALKPGDRLEGHPSIGAGIALDVAGITKEEADHLLSNRLARARADASTFLFYARLTPARRDVIAAMCYNLGLAGLRGFPKMLEALMREDYLGAANQMLSSRWAGQVGARATRLADVMRSGEYPSAGVGGPSEPSRPA